MVKRIITFFFLLIALTAFTLLVTLIPEILGAELTSEKGQGFLLVVFGENYAWWLLLILVLAIAVLFFFTPEQIKALFKREEKPIALSHEENQKNYDTIRQYLRQRYERRKDQKLAGDQLFNLRIKPTTEGTSPEKADTFITLQGRKTGEEIQQIFEKARRRLLVTGLPGAGKTSLLLNLALELLELLETDHENLAVLLNLATWRSDFPSFDDWLREILPAELGVIKRYAADILQAGKLTLLLDGLDEVDEAHRASCLKAIGEYGRLGRDYVISTRKDEYKALEKDAPVWAQIEVLPLTDKQLLAQLDRADRRDFPEAPDLKAALEHDPLLLKVAETPFYLNCLQLLFRGGNTVSELNFKDETLEVRQAEIIKRFTEQALAMQSKQGYTPKQVQHWLYFFASRLTQRNKVVFELVDLKYDWWRWEKVEKFIINFANNLVYWLFVSLFYYPMVVILFTLSGGIFHGLKFGLFWFFGVLILGVINKTPKDLPSITTREKASYSWKYYLNHLKGLIKITTISITVICLISVYLKDINLLAGGVCGMLTFLAFVSFANMARQNHGKLLQITTPYQRFTTSAKALHFSILQHWLLRWQLYRAGVLPLRLVHFLHEMTARHLLETDGATWRFRHRILQEHFAKQWKEKDDEKP